MNVTGICTEHSVQLFREHPISVAEPNKPIILYGFPLSGHAHRVALFLSLLDLPFQEIVVDLPAGAQKQPDFLALNPFGQVPVIDDSGVVISDSTAILVYLASKYGAKDWLPQEPVARAEVQRWLSVASGQIANGPAAARLVALFGVPLDHQRAKTIAESLFGVLDRHLDGRDYLVGAGPTIADVAGYSYIAHAPEGDVSLQPYPHILAWLARIEALPGFIGMAKSRTAA